MDKVEFDDAKHIANFAMKMYNVSLADKNFHEIHNQTSNRNYHNRAITLAKGTYERQYFKTDFPKP